MFVTAHFQSQRYAASCVKDSGKVRSHGQQCESVSLVSGREDELCGELATVYEVCKDTVKLQTSLSVCRGAGGHVEPVWLCVCVNICVYGCWEGADSDALVTYRLCPIFIHIWPIAQYLKEQFAQK